MANEPYPAAVGPGRPRAAAGFIVSATMMILVGISMSSRPGSAVRQHFTWSRAPTLQSKSPAGRTTGLGVIIAFAAGGCCPADLARAVGSSLPGERHRQRLFIPYYPLVDIAIVIGVL